MLLLHLFRVTQQILYYGLAPETTSDPNTTLFAFLCNLFLSNSARTAVCIFLYRFEKCDGCWRARAGVGVTIHIVCGGGGVRGHRGI